MPWWKYGVIAGYVLPAITILVFPWYYSPLLAAIALHFLLDFNVQTNDTACRKANGEVWPLVYHSVLSGFFSGLPFGLVVAFAVAAIHLLIDACNKFGVEGWKGGVLDQSLHLVTLVAIYTII